MVLYQQKKQMTVSVQSTPVPNKRKFGATIAVPHQIGLTDHGAGVLYKATMPSHFAKTCSLVTYV